MSNVYSMPRSEMKNAIGVYITDNVGGSGAIARAELLLAGFPHGAEKAIGSAIKRAATSGEAYAAQTVSKYYTIKVTDFKQYTQSKRHIRTSVGQTEVDISFRGRHIPLLKFNTKIGGDGLVRTQVKRSSSAEVLAHVFRQKVGNQHIGVFERVSSSRYPIEEKYGPSTPQMMDANDDVSQAIGDKIRETFDERIEHEILAIMNGWRR
ncbi:MAG: hypothetical protein J1F28_04575 [Oscillospiraceae bacterium]|nr:hypothetical protein [Oscillospiraceae bacterium]